MFFLHSVLAPIFRTAAFLPPAGIVWGLTIYSLDPWDLPQCWEQTTPGKGGGEEVINELGYRTTGNFADTGAQDFPYVICGIAMIGHDFPKSSFTQVTEEKAVNLISLIHFEEQSILSSDWTRSIPYTVYPFWRTVSIWKKKITYFLIPVLKNNNTIIMTQEIRICKIF